MYDLLLQGGTVVDGTGGPARRADVAVQADRIVAIGSLDGTDARKVVDVTGKVVAPGFIDVHNHSDGWLLKRKHLLAKTSQGITTEVLMSDGISYAPLEPETVADWFVYLRPLNGLQLEDYRGWRSIADYMALLDRRNVQNSIAQIPYANLRVLAAGWQRGPLDDTQINLMRRHVNLEMEAGAVGLSTGLDYIAECFATTDELVRVCEALADWDGIYVTHVRYKEGVLRGVQEAVEIGRRAGVKVHISHLKSLHESQTEELLDYIDRVASSEVDFSFDVYPYMPGSTLLASLLPYEAWEDGPLAVPSRVRDPLIRRRFAELLEEYRLPLDRIHIAWVAGKDNAKYEGQSLAQYIAARDKPAAEALLDLLIEENLTVLGVFRLGDDKLIEPFIAHPLQMHGSDGIYCDGGLVHPRVYGSAPRMLGPLVRDARLYSLEEAVRKLSGFPAARFGLKDRGVVREGAIADLVVFDPKTVCDRATYDNPHQTAEGIDSVVVSGVEILSDGQPVELPGPELPGRALRYKA